MAQRWWWMFIYQWDYYTANEPQGIGRESEAVRKPNRQPCRGAFFNTLTPLWDKSDPLQYAIPPSVPEYLCGSI